MVLSEGSNIAASDSSFMSYHTTNKLRIVARIPDPFSKEKNRRDGGVRETEAAVELLRALGDQCCREGHVEREQMSELMIRLTV